MVYSDSGIFNGISLVLCPQPQGQGHFFMGRGVNLAVTNCALEGKKNTHLRHP